MITKYLQYLNEKISSFDDKFMDYAIEMFFKKIDRIISKGNKGSFSFYYSIDNKPLDYKNQKIKINVIFDPSSKIRNSYCSNNGVWSPNKRVVISTKWDKTKDKIFSAYIHEIQHIPQQYTDIYVNDWEKEGESYFEYCQRLKERSKDIGGRKLKPMSAKKFYHNIAHNQRNSEKEAVLTQILYLLKYDFMDQAVKEASYHGSYFTFTRRQFLNKSYYTGTPLNKIKEWEIKLVQEFEEEILNPRNRFVTSDVIYNTKAFSYFKDDLPILVMIEKERYFAEEILKRVEEEYKEFLLVKDEKDEKWLSMYNGRKPKPGFKPPSEKTEITYNNVIDFLLDLIG